MVMEMTDVAIVRISNTNGAERADRQTGFEV